MNKQCKHWWKIEALNEDYLEVEFFIRAKEILQVCENGMTIDGNDFYSEHSIRKIYPATPATYNISLFTYVLDTYFKYEFNDSNTWKLFTEYFPGTICDNSVNTPEVLNRNVIRFSYNNILYEYDPNSVKFLKVNPVD